MNALSAAFSSATGAVAAVALAEQQTDAAIGKHALLHGEALLVIATTDAEHVALGTHVHLQSQIMWGGRVV